MDERRIGSPGAGDPTPFKRDRVGSDASASGGGAAAEATDEFEHAEAAPTRRRIDFSTPVSPKELVDKMPDPASRDFEPYVLQARDDTDRTLFHLAAEEGNSDLFDLLLRHTSLDGLAELLSREDIDGEQAAEAILNNAPIRKLMVAFLRELPPGNLNIFLMAIQESGAKEVILHLANASDFLERASSEALEEFLQTTEAIEDSPLHVAFQNNMYLLTKMLLSRLRPEAVSELLCSGDHNLFAEYVEHPELGMVSWMADNLDSAIWEHLLINNREAQLNVDDLFKIAFGSESEQNVLLKALNALGEVRARELLARNGDSCRELLETNHERLRPELFALMPDEVLLQTAMESTDNKCLWYRWIDSGSASLIQLYIDRFGIERLMNELSASSWKSASHVEELLAGMLDRVEGIEGLLPGSKDGYYSFASATASLEAFKKIKASHAAELSESELKYISLAEAALRKFLISSGIETSMRAFISSEPLSANQTATFEILLKASTAYHLELFQRSFHGKDLAGKYVSVGYINTGAGNEKHSPQKDRRSLTASGSATRDYTAASKRLLIPAGVMNTVEFWHELLKNVRSSDADSPYTHLMASAEVEAGESVVVPDEPVMIAAGIEGHTSIFTIFSISHDMASRTDADFSRPQSGPTCWFTSVASTLGAIALRHLTFDRVKKMKALLKSSMLEICQERQKEFHSTEAVPENIEKAFTFAELQVNRASSRAIAAKYATSDQKTYVDCLLSLISAVDEERAKHYFQLLFHTFGEEARWTEEDAKMIDEWIKSPERSSKQKERIINILSGNTDIKPSIAAEA